MSSSRSHDETRTGTLYGFAAYLIWGGFPLYFHALAPTGAWEVLAHRILWTMLLCVAGLLVLHQFRPVLSVLRTPRRLALITVAALGYFLNPLVTVALGVLLLKETLRPLQWAAIAVGAVACVYLAIDYGKPPWISLGLAFSFATYGLVKKRVGGSMTALHSLSAETIVLTPVALLILSIIAARGEQTFTTHGAWHSILLALSGVATAIPLLLFAAAARRVPLVTIGLLQFITPILQLLCGVLLLNEHMPTSRWIGFAIVWVALALLTVDSIHSASRSRRLARAAEGAAC